MKTSERTKAAFGGESVRSWQSARLGGGGAVATASTAAPDPALSPHLRLPEPKGVPSAPGPRRHRTVEGKAGLATPLGASAAPESPGALCWPQNPRPGQRGFVGGEWVSFFSGLAGPPFTMPLGNGG